MGHPPLRDFGDFLLIGDFFLPFESQNELPPRHLLYILEDEPSLITALVTNFRQLTARLRGYPPLAEFVQYI